MRKIERYQMQKIFAIGSALGMVENRNEEDDLHLLIGGLTGKKSVKDLTYQEAGAVISKLEGLQGNTAPPKKSAKKSETVPGGVTEGQQKKIWGLMYELKGCDKEANQASVGSRLCGIIEKELKISCGVKEPFKWIDYKNGNKLIEIMKKYIVSAKKGKG